MKCRREVGRVLRLIASNYVDMREFDDGGRQSVGRPRDGIVWAFPAGAQSAVSLSRGLTNVTDDKCCHQGFSMRFIGSPCRLERPCLLSC